MPEKTTAPAEPAVDLDKPVTDVQPEPAADTDTAPHDVVIVFDRNLAGGYEEGDRVILARTPFVDGLITAGVAHEATAADDLVVITDAGPVVTPPAA